ncbi:MAG: ATP-binding cassette domain-containing protein [Balneolaceae bacterium]|nr:ATP-binding cassette domain-containing protein [Balneolaceae bacterium]
MAIIDVHKVKKSFGKTTAVNNVSFEVHKGRIFGLLGPNGAGKTTCIRMINHILIPDSGSIKINGIEASPETQKMIGYMPEERGLYKKMKVGEQLLYLAQLKGLARDNAKRAIKYWLQRFEAIDWYNKEVGELSKGCPENTVHCHHCSRPGYLHF